MGKLLLSLIFNFFVILVSAQLASLQVGDVAPDFNVTDLDGRVYKKSDFAGKFVLVDMFFTACGPCQGVSPIINQLFVKYGCNNYDLKVLAIETSTDNAATHAYETIYGGNQQHLTPTCSGTQGGGNVFQGAYDATAFPTIIIIGPDGKLKNVDLWPVGDLSSLESALTAAGATLTPRACINSAVGLENLQMSDVKFFPNPVTDGRLNFEFNGRKAVYAIQLLNVVGQVVKNQSFFSNDGENSISLDVSDLNRGTYLFKITSDEGSSFVQSFQIK